MSRREQGAIWAVGVAARAVLCCVTVVVPDIVAAESPAQAPPRAPQRSTLWTVDEAVIESVAGAVGSRWPEPGYTRSADIDRSGAVDERDLLIFRSGRGRQFGPPGSYVAGELVVRFADGWPGDVRPGAAAGSGADEEGLRMLARELGARELGRSLDGRYYRIGFPQLAAAPTSGRTWTEPELSLLLQARPEIAVAEPNGKVWALLQPNDPLYGRQWHFAILRMEEAWDLVPGGAPSTVIAVIDTGVAYENYGQLLQAPDLAQTSFAAGYDFVDRDTHPQDLYGHGTHVAGTIAQSTGNAEGVAGICFACSVMPVRVLNANGEGTELDVADGVLWATEHGAAVINMSLGGPTDAAPLRDAVARAAAQGVVIIAAAGNGGEDGVGDAEALFPAAYPEVVAVGAVRYDKTLTRYSNYGPDVDIVAPGGDATVDQNGDRLGDGIFQNTFFLPQLPNWFDYPAYYQGTSMAAPHVAGIAGLLISAGIQDRAKIIEALLATAWDLGDKGRDDLYGNGLVNPVAALQYWGTGGPGEDDDWGWLGR
ncbi:MAG: peptidase S8 [Candidatus Schekmanbacteria bacterium]|nr:peptidase S8 [Candidatus Schekmanbacteria bacterium]